MKNFFNAISKDPLYTARTIFYFVLISALLTMIIYGIGFMSILTKQMDANGNELRGAINSIHGVTLSIRKNFTDNNDRINTIQTNTFEALGKMNTSIANSMSNIDKKVALTADELALFLKEARTLVKDTNNSINNPNSGLIAELNMGIRDLKGMIAVVVNDQLAGFLKAGTDDLKVMGSGLNQLFGDAHITLSEVNTNLSRIGKNVEDTTFYIAQITKTGSEVAEYYKKALLHPSKWQRFKEVMNIVMYGMGEIFIPWYVTKKVEVVN